MHGVWDKTNDINAYITSNGHEYNDSELKTRTMGSNEERKGHR